MIMAIKICFAESNEGKKSYHTIGVGTVICYDFLHPSDGKQSSTRDAIFMSWAQGYMSAKNLYSEYNTILGSMDIDEQLVIIKIYCEEHKRNVVLFAVDNLYTELLKRQMMELKKEK
jgi:hypothetical protein